MLRAQHRVLAPIVALILLAVGCTGGGSDKRSAAPTAPLPLSSTSHPSTTPPPPLAQSRADQFSADLASGQTRLLSDSVALPSGAPLAKSAAAELKALKPIRFDLASFRPTGADTATVRATTARGPYVVNLVLIQDSWFIATTEPAK